LELGLGLGLRHDVLKTSVSNNFVHIRRIGIRRNGAEPWSGRSSSVQHTYALPYAVDFVWYRIVFYRMLRQTAAAKRRKKKNKNKQKPATTIENGDASSTTSTVNDAADSMDHTHEPPCPLSDAADTRIPQSSVTSSIDSFQAQVVNGSAGMSVGKPDPAPVLIHVGDKVSGGLPNGFVNSRAKVITNSSSSKGSWPVNLGKKLVV